MYIVALVEDGLHTGYKFLSKHPVTSYSDEGVTYVSLVASPSTVDLSLIVNSIEREWESANRHSQLEMLDKLVDGMIAVVGEQNTTAILYYLIMKHGLSIGL